MLAKGLGLDRRPLPTATGTTTGPLGEEGLKDGRLSGRLKLEMLAHNQMLVHSQMIAHCQIISHSKMIAHNQMLAHNQMISQSRMIAHTVVK